MIGEMTLEEKLTADPLRGEARRGGGGRMAEFTASSHPLGDQ